MIAFDQIPEPILFNPLKHHLGFIKEFINQKSDGVMGIDQAGLVRELKHLGTSVMDVYTGALSVGDICIEVFNIMKEKSLTEKQTFAQWTGTGKNDFRIIPLSDGSQWAAKYSDNIRRYIHIFPGRGSRNTFRVKSNTLKSALLYYIIIGKDFITGDDLNRVRPLLGLSPVKDPADAEAITEMIEILRESSI